MKINVMLVSVLFLNSWTWSQDHCSYQCEIPSSFTPNNDEENDKLMANWDCKPEDFEATIYSRWGQEIFTTQDPIINFDGFDKNGNEVEAGNYFVSLKYKTDGEEMNKTFYFTIIK